MDNNHSKTESKIIRTIIYNLIIFFIIILWYSYSTYDNKIGLVLISLSIATLILYSFIFNVKINNKITIKIFHGIIMIIPISFVIEISLFYEPFNPPIFISFYRLIGIDHKHNIVLFLFYFSLTILKVIPIKFFYDKIIKMFKNEKIDEYIEYFVEDINAKKYLLMFILLPLVAFIEEFVFRSLLLTVLVKYFNWYSLIAVFFISIVFGYSHYSASKNWGHFLSTFISSIIYFFTLIQLGLIYCWILHLTTNSLALLFFYQNNKKEEKVIPRSKLTKKK